MPSLTRSLEERIQELKSSIESQTAELAAYEKVLEIEVANLDQAHQKGVTDTTQMQESTATPMEAQWPTGERVASETGLTPDSGTETGPQFRGNKTDFIAAIIEAAGVSGATPKEIDAVFASRRIERSKNLIYNVLSSFLKQGKLEKKDGRYLAVSADSSQKLGGPRKRTISAEGLKRIRAANKKRWTREKSTRGALSKSVPKKSVRRAGKKVAPKKAGTKAAMQT